MLYTCLKFIGILCPVLTTITYHCLRFGRLMSRRNDRDRERERREEDLKRKEEDLKKKKEDEERRLEEDRLRRRFVQS